MYEVTVTITRLFDVHRVPASRFSAKHTLFGFESLNLKKPFVRVLGWPRLEVGDTLIVLLAQQGNWQSLRGWKNLTNGEKVGPSVAISAGRVGASVLFAAPFIYMLMDEVSGHPLWFPFWAATGCVAAAMNLDLLIKAFKTQQWLNRS